MTTPAYTHSTMSDLTQHQQTLLAHYHRARTAWESGGWVTHDGTAYAAALDACLDAGFDPFHHPQPQ